MSKYLLEIDLGGVRMDPHGPVLIRMVPGYLFQWFPGPKPMKIVKSIGLGFLGDGGRGAPCPGPCLVAYVGSSLIWPYGLLMV